MRRSEMRWSRRLSSDDPARADRAQNCVLQRVSPAFGAPCMRTMCAAGTPAERHRSDASVEKLRFTAFKQCFACAAARCVGRGNFRVTIPCGPIAPKPMFCRGFPLLSGPRACEQCAPPGRSLSDTAAMHQSKSCVPPRLMRCFARATSDSVGLPSARRGDPWQPMAPKPVVSRCFLRISGSVRCEFQGNWKTFRNRSPAADFSFKNFLENP